MTPEYGKVITGWMEKVRLEEESRVLIQGTKKNFSKLKSYNCQYRISNPHEFPI
jgi:hypothetical protein